MVVPGNVFLGKWMGSIPRRLFRILPHHDASDIRPVRLTGVFHLLGVFASGNLSGVLGRKTAISFQELAGP